MFNFDFQLGKFLEAFSQGFAVAFEIGGPSGHEIGFGYILIIAAVVSGIVGVKKRRK